MASELIQQILKVRRLPTPSTTALRILELAESDKADVLEISNVISSDPAIAARILKFANSSQLGSTREVTTVSQAVLRLGIRAVKVTALSFSLLSQRDVDRCPGFDADQFWAHALATAVAARSMIPAGGPANPEEAFIVGLLSRLGKLVLSVALPEKYAVVLQQAGSVNAVTIERERVALGTDHIEAGAALLEHWKLPAVVHDSIRNQQQPDSASTPESKLLAQAIGVGHSAADCLIGMTKDVTEALVKAPERLAVPREPEAVAPWLQAQEKVFREMAAAMSISLDSMPDQSELQSRATELITELSMMTAVENKSIQEERQTLELRAAHDCLTGAFNRSAFEERLKEALSRVETSGEPLALILLDIDYFKKINDTFGHLAGDSILKLVIQATNGAVRSSDFLARYGGEEFAIIAPNTNLALAAALAERVRKAVHGAKYDLGGVALRVSISLGVAVYQSGDSNVDSSAVIKAADSAMYEAKRRGRNRCWFSKVGSTPPKKPDVQPSGNTVVPIGVVAGHQGPISGGPVARV